jgi:hypothetical protein
LPDGICTRWIPLSGFTYSASVPPLPSFPQRDKVLLHTSDFAN